VAEEPNQIKRHIDATRRELGKNMHELENRMKEATDWHTYVNKSPMTALGVAFGGGVVLSAFIGGRSNYRNGRHPLARAVEGSYPRGVESRKSDAADMFDNVKGAMIGWTANQLKTVLNEWLPGFRQEYERTESEKKSRLHELAS
jgi:hypothetical protein